MSGSFLRILLSSVLSLSLLACGGGSGGSTPKPPADADGDGYADAQDAFPNDPKEWLDTDKDGVGDNADPTPMGSVIPAWTTYQGNSKHSGYIDINLTTSHFKSRWAKPIELASLKQGAAGDGYIFVNNAGQLYALDARTGTTLWSQSLNTGTHNLNNFNQPAYADGVVYVQTGGHGDAFLWAFNSADGRLLFKTPLDDQWSSFYAPTIVDGTVYIGGGYYGGIYAIDAKSGVQKWWQTLNQYDQFTPAISGDYVLAYTGDYAPKLTVANKTTGNVMFEIADPDFQWNGWSMHLAPVVAGDFVLANHYGRLVAFNLASKTLAWQLDAGFTGDPVTKGDIFYITNNGVIEARKLDDGSLVSSIAGTSAFTGNLLLTNNLIFASDEQNTYAYQLDNGAKIWTLEKTRGALLMAEGALVIFGNNSITTVDLEGDIDSDGLPDWWEKRLKKNVNASGDDDNDKLSGKQEFELGTNPNLADTDGDGLLDGEEVSAKTSPITTDTDNDGLLDGAEVKTHLSDPTKADSDGDKLNDAEEVAAGLSPTNSADASQDADGDGFSNAYEVRANTSISDASKHPEVSGWSTTSGNSMGNSYVPLLLDDSQFSQIWSNTNNAMLSETEPVTAGHHLVMRVNNQFQQWDTATGQEVWRTSISAYNPSSPAIDGNRLVVLSNTPGTSNTHLHIWDSNSGAILADKDLTPTGYFTASQPLVRDNKLYLANSNRNFYAYSLDTGNLLWTSGLSLDYFSGNWRHLASDEHLIGVTSSKLVVYSAQNGNLLNTIGLPVNYSLQTAILGSKNNVIVLFNTGQLASIDLANGINMWSNSNCGFARLAVGNGKVYALSQQKLCVFDEQTGAFQWELPIANPWHMSNPVLTASHLFYSDGTNIYAIDLQKKQVTWTLNKRASQLSMSADGILFVQDSASVTAIDTLGDTDADGMPQFWERRYGGDLLANGDNDADGLTNLDEFIAKSNPIAADTDGDGLNDGAEINTHQSSPVNADTDNDGLNDSAEINIYATSPRVGDTDSDGMDDYLEITYGLDANANDASTDVDNDGINNRDEVYAGAEPNNAASKPLIGDWSPRQGNAAHNAFQPYRVNAANFNLRWLKDSNRYTKSISAGNRQVFFVSELNGTTSLAALNAVDGRDQWQHNLGASDRIHSAGYMNSQLMVSTSNPSSLKAFNANTGTTLFSSEYPNYSYSDYPLSLFGNTAYTNLGYSNGIVAKNLFTGTTLWNKNNRSHTTDIAVNNQYVFAISDQRIYALDRSTGNDVFAINIQGTSAENPVLGTRNNLLLVEQATSSKLVSSYDITRRKLAWTVQATSIWGSPVAGNGQVYVIRNGQLQSLSETNGSLVWSWEPDNQYLNSNIVATYSHIFVSSNEKTYALSANSGELLWTYELGGQLSLGADGALYIQGNTMLMAISLEGDSDGDTMPDWWERHYGLNPATSSDAGLDKDGDGLTNLQEYKRKTYADKADSDDDQLSDLIESNTLLTHPLNNDTDSDGMPDGWEVTHSLNPRNAADRDSDSDGDTVPNYFEYAKGTNPNNALSLPVFFTPGQFSFEDSQLPSSWSISNDTTDLSVSLGVASHGTKALQARNAANIKFSGFFAASDLSLDVKYGCSGSTWVEVYIDDQLQARVDATGEWSTLNTLIPYGEHTVSIRTNSYSCSVYLDNVVIAAAKTNTELGVQFVTTNNGNIQFYDIKGSLKRQIMAQLPPSNTQIKNIAAIGNDYLAFMFDSDQSRVGLLNLKTFSWRYLDELDAMNSSYYSGQYAMAATNSVIYVATVNPFNSVSIIEQLNLNTGGVDSFGSHAYNSIALDSQGYIYAHANYSGVVYKYDPTTLTLVSETNVSTASQIMIDHLDRLVVLTTNNELLRYNAQRLVETRLQLNGSINSMAINNRGDLFLNFQNGTVLHYSPDWQRVKTFPISAAQLTSFPQVDTDGDQIPDWWELEYGFAANSANNANSDTDSDGLTTLEEFNADTNPSNADTDGDLLNDGDEVEDYTTNPNKQDSDDDGLSDADELLTHNSNPLIVDTDGDQINDYLEAKVYLTNPNDANSKPTGLSNFIESFESGNGGWIRPSGDADASWTVVSDSASAGTKSLRSAAINDNQTAETEWTAVFNNSTLSFHARVSSESCCDRLLVYLDDILVFNIQTDDQWVGYQLNMTAGVHTLRFVYKKDSSSKHGSDSAWIDYIQVQ